MRVEEIKIKAEEWLNNLYERERADNTIKQYNQTLRFFLNFLEENKIEEVNKRCMIDYKKFLIEDKERNLRDPKSGRRQTKRNSTINTRLVVLNGFLKSIGLNDCVVDLIKDNTINRATTGLSAHDLERIIEWGYKLGHDRTALALETLMGTGLRCSELKAVTVEALKDRMNEVESKTGTRMIYIPKKLAKKLKEYCKENNIKNGIIFHGSTPYTLMDLSNFRKDMKMIAGKARGINLDKVHPHEARHIFSQRFLDMPGTNLYDLSDILGHSIKRLPITAIYTRRKPEELLKIMDQLEQYYTKPKKKGKKGRNK